MNVWPWSRGRGGNGERGFTFIEILVVVVIIAIAAAVAVPMMNQDSVRVPAAARMVVADLSYAQNVASTRMVKVYVLFKTDDSGSITSYEIATTPNPSDAGDYVARPADGGPMKAVFGPDPSATSPLQYVRINSAKAGSTATLGFGFDEQGQPLYLSSGSYVALSGSTGAGIIHLTNAGNTVAHDVTVQPVTGLVSTPQ